MSKKPWEDKVSDEELEEVVDADFLDDEDEFEDYDCLLYTSPSPRDA